MEKEFFECDCSTHALHVAKFEDEPEFYFAIWHRGRVDKPQWSVRLKLIWKIISTGTPYGDEVVLSGNNAKKLIDFISKNLNEKRTRK